MLPKRQINERGEKGQAAESVFPKRKGGILGGSWAGLGRSCRLFGGYVFAWSAAT